MSMEEEISVVSDDENARKSDGTSTAGEHNVDKVNEESSVKKEDKQNDDEIKNEDNKNEIDQVEEKFQDETIVSTTINQKSQGVEPEIDESNSEKPNEELTVV
jgi:hypothetical protein